MINLSVKEMIEAGFAISRIAGLLLLPLNYIKQEVTENNYELLKEDFNESKIDYICDLYIQGVSAKILGKKFSIDKRRVQKWAKNRGINIRKPGEAQRVISWNEHCFDNIDTPEKAYFLGFCYADAYNSQSVNSFKIALKSDDVDHLRKFARLLNYPQNEVSLHIDLENKINTCNISLHSKYFCSQMAKLGCPQAKSFIIKYPDFLKPEFNNHFIRGYFDGDGCITKRKSNNEWKFDIAGTLNICNKIKNIIFNSLNLNISIYPKNNIYLLETNGNKKILQILDWLYYDSTEEMRLDRKYEKYLELKEQQANRKSWHAKQL